MGDSSRAKAKLSVNASTTINMIINDVLTVERKASLIIMCESVQDGTYLRSWIMEFGDRYYLRNQNGRENMVTVRIRNNIDFHWNTAMMRG